MSVADESLRRLRESIEASMRSGKKMREVVAVVAAAQGITVDEAERRIEAMRQRLFPDQPT